LEDLVVRTRVKLTDSQARALRRLAAAEGRSMADVIRESVEALLADRGVRDRREVQRRAVAVVGAFRSGVGDLAAEHDRYLAEAFAE
jgi:Arc/MetJ-type ribon-helix-helix transcriptional regulator